MPLTNTANHWGSISKLLHWLIVGLIGWLAWLGLTMVDMPATPAKINTYALHKSLGLTLLALVSLRLLWRLYAGAPAPVTGTPRWQVRVAGITHIGLYVLMFAMPLSGWLFNSAAGYPLQWFKLFNLPALAGDDEALAALALQVHQTGFWLLLLLVAGHVGAALYHHLFQGDETLRRMLPALRRRSVRPRSPEN